MKELFSLSLLDDTSAVNMGGIQIVIVAMGDGVLAGNNPSQFPPNEGKNSWGLEVLSVSGLRHGISSSRSISS